LIEFLLFPRHSSCRKSQHFISITFAARPSRFSFQEVYYLWFILLIAGIVQTGLAQNLAKDEFEDDLACLVYHSTLGGFLQPVGKLSSASQF